ncbi:MAG: NAD(P)H-dependent oxidoreductase subunit E [Alphaproteobacteria bacterium]|nr:NAD(P)H-dependent oxidoreductase subunit E [Alphaproteobacteria bacterium]
MAKEQKELAEKYDVHIFCCNSTSCRSAGGESVLEALESAVKSNELEEKVRVVKTGCMGLCSLGPLVQIEIKGREPVMYKKVTPLLARLIVLEYVAKAIETPKEQPLEISEFLSEHILPLDIPFFTKQEKVVLSNMCKSNPESLAEYVAHGGYQALKKVLDTMKPEEVIEEIKKSGLRGRGGAGFPTGLKWEFASKVTDTEKFFICNADEGDPGAYMDSCTLEGDPHAVLEGMLIGAYAMGATTGWFYIRAEYPLAVERMENAIRQAKKFGLLGNNILGSGFNFMVELRLGAGAFVCGEETALMASLEGKRGSPRPRPPYPVKSGLFGKSSCINNVETLANIPKIIAKGADWFASMGTDKSKGTKVFALTGRVQNGGLVEVPMGTTIREIVEEIGGGVADGKKLKAVQTGGPSGGLIPEDQIDLQVCYDRLKAVGSIMGSGGMIVMDEDDSIVDIATFYLGFTVDESCGKCAPCRIGGYQMLQLLKKVADRKGTKEDVEKIKQIAHAMQKASLCGLGMTAPNPVLSSLKFFPEEYEERLIKTGSDAE